MSTPHRYEVNLVLTQRGTEFSFENAPKAIKEEVALLVQLHGTDGDAMPNAKKLRVKQLAERYGAAHP